MTAPTTLIAPEELPSSICTAHSKTTGTQCTKWAIPGGTVCHIHGGNAPQTRNAALARIVQARDLALDRLIEGLAPPESPMFAVEVKDLLAVVDKLTSKVQLLSGEATSRDEKNVRVDEVRERLEIRLSSLHARVSDASTIIDVEPIEPLSSEEEE